MNFKLTLDIYFANTIVKRFFKNK